MKLLKHSLIIAIVTLSALSGCKKYPDGPLISLRTKEHRLVGHWDVENFTVNGSDSTAYLKSRPFYGTYKFQDGEYGVGDFIYRCQDNTYTLAGHWIFENSKKNLRLSLQGASSTNSVGAYAAENVSWEIRRLKEKELWLKTNYNGNEYFLKLKQ